MENSNHLPVRRRDLEIKYKKVKAEKLIVYATSGFYAFIFSKKVDYLYIYGAHQRYQMNVDHKKKQKQKKRTKKEAMIALNEFLYQPPK